MPFKDAQQAKQYLLKAASDMKETTVGGIQVMAGLASKGRKIIEARAEKATGDAAESMLKDM